MAPKTSTIRSKSTISCFEKDNWPIFPISAQISDGTTQLLSGCLRDFRNKPFPTRARIEYYKNTLTVLFNNGMTQNPDEYELCLRSENVVLPPNGYFGVSAATGGLADDHDVYHFLTTSLHQPGKLQEPVQMPEDAAKLTQEYQKYQSELEQKKKEYKDIHPEKEPQYEDWFETDNARELRQIWQSQSQMTDLMKDLSRKMDEVIGRQERTMGLLSVNAQGGQQPPPVGGAPAIAPQYSDTIRRHEVEAIIQNQNQFIQTVREIKQQMDQLQARSDSILQNQGRQPTAHVQSANGYDVQSMLSEMRNSFNEVKTGISNVHQK